MPLLEPVIGKLRLIVDLQPTLRRGPEALLKAGGIDGDQAAAVRPALRSAGSMSSGSGRRV